MIDRFIWWLPRPSRSKYKGSFPLHFERKILNYLDLNENRDKIFQPFGGGAELGLIMDIKKDEKYPERIVGDAHDIPFTDEMFDLVLCDPPYSDEENKQLYDNNKPLKQKQWIQEAVRVCKKGGYIVLYHKYKLPRPKGTSYQAIGAIITRTYHVARIVIVVKKD